jgi:Eukaryotic aspartyl protease
VNADCSTALSAAQSAWCETNPDYNSGTSSTVVDEDVPFDLEYGTGSAQGEYLEDTAYVNGIPVPNTIFGDASTSNDMAAGIWGVCFGYPLNTEYYTLLDLMYLDGIINSRAFSLDLMSVDTTEGKTSHNQPSSCDMFFYSANYLANSVS